MKIADLSHSLQCYVVEGTFFFSNRVERWHSYEILAGTLGVTFAWTIQENFRILFHKEERPVTRPTCRPKRASVPVSLSRM